MQGLSWELRKLGMRNSSVTSNMIDVARKLESVREGEVITEPERVKKLAMIAQAFMAGNLTQQQAADMVRKV